MKIVNFLVTRVSFKPEAGWLSFGHRPQRSRRESDVIPIADFAPPRALGLRQLGSASFPGSMLLFPSTSSVSETLDTIQNSPIFPFPPTHSPNLCSPTMPLLRAGSPALLVCLLLVLLPQVHAFGAGSKLDSSPECEHLLTYFRHCFNLDHRG